MAGAVVVGLIADAVAQGLLLALLGVGITLVFGLGEVLNLALGMFSILTVTTALALIGLGLPVWPAAGLAIVLVSGFALAIDRAVLSFVYRLEGEDRILLGIFSTLGLAFFIEGALFNYFAFRFSLPADFPLIDVAGFEFPGSRLVVVVISGLLLAGLFVFLRYSFAGRVTQTIVQDETGAEHVGIEPRPIRSGIFVLSTAFAGVAGLLASLISDLSVASGFELTVFALIVSIMGGIRSVTGAVVAGLILGFVQTYANFFIGAYISNIIIFGAVVGVLLLKPGARF